MTQFRLEKDSLGEVKVPSDACYGAQTQRAIENFDYSPNPLASSFIATLLRIKAAAAMVNGELGELPTSIAESIKDAVEHLLTSSNWMQHFPVNVYQTGSGTSTNMNANEVIAHFVNHFNPSLNVHPNDHINRGQSSNDVIPSCIQLAFATQITDQLLPALKQLTERLLQQQSTTETIFKTGRTHLMDAMPLSVGQELATWRQQIIDAQERIVASLPRLLRLPLGGTAIGTGINRHAQYPERICQQLTLDFALPITPAENCAANMSAQDATLEMHGQLKVLATALIKISNDLRWMNSGPESGLGEIALTPVQPGSSIMPAKVNPVILESIVMMCTQVLGNDTTVTLANQSGNFQLNVMLPLIAQVSLTSTQLLCDSVNALADKVIGQFSINQDLLAERLAKNPILVTALNPLIGYELAATIAKTAVAQQRTIIDVAEEMTDLSRAQLEQVLALEHLAYPHRSDHESVD
ncbi:MAG: class II fumarate hydratase [Gammaproteobacteria bacterium]|nr:class II fumarate hydratase [Gammaproteobacteria bacterium]NVK86572.1 class II fumarate hydratase [Gammaproteobacteria bacterium]